MHCCLGDGDQMKLPKMKFISWTVYILVWFFTVELAMAQSGLCKESFVDPSEKIYWVKQEPYSKIWPRRPKFPLYQQKVRIQADLIDQRIYGLFERYPDRLMKHYVPAEDGTVIHVWRVLNPRATKTVLISGGVHGDEALGSLVAYDFIRHAVTGELRGLEQFEFIVVPVVNEKAVSIGYRYLNEEGNYNRQFSRGEEGPARVDALEKWLDGKDIFAHFDLHQAPTKSHFFAIRMSNDNSGVAEGAIEALPPGERMQLTTYEPYMSRPSKYTQIVPGVVSSDNPNTFKEFTAKRGAISLTMEAPGRYPVELARQNYLKFLMAAIDHLNSL